MAPRRTPTRGRREAEEALMTAEGQHGSSSLQHNGVNLLPTTGWRRLGGWQTDARLAVSTRLPSS